MTGVPGGDVTLHAAITAELDLHRPCPCGCSDCLGHPSEDDDSPRWTPSHAADRVLAVLADRLPHTPPDQLAGLIGGDWETAYSDPTLARVVGPWVPDSPPAAPEPRQDT